MQWQVRHDQAQKIKVTLMAEAMSDDRPIPYTVGKLEGDVRISARARCLHVTKREGRGLAQLTLEKNYRLRNLRSQKFTHDSEFEIYAEINGVGAQVLNFTAFAQIYTPATDKVSKSSSGGIKVLRSPISGNIIKINFKNGDAVNSGDVVLIIEAMKMENKIFAPVSGVLHNLKVLDKVAVQVGQELFSINT